MSVGNILSIAGAKMGINPSSSGRTTLLRFLNEAANELYTQADLAGSLYEQVFKVNGDQTISCPVYVGQVRAIREYNSMQPWHINQMRPRYNQYNWKDMWRNFRLKNKQPLMATVVNQSQGVITVPAVELPFVVVTVSGPTLTAELATETVILDSTSKNTVNNYTDYNAVTKDRVNLYNITLSDIDGKVLTVIPNNEKEAKYQIIDISSSPWLPSSTSQMDNYVEILYKKTLPYLSLDSDEFPAIGYDHVIVNKMMQLWAEEQNKGDVASAYDAKATRTAARIHEDQNRATEDLVALVSNPHDTLRRRVGSGRRRRYSMQGRTY